MDHHATSIVLFDLIMFQICAFFS